ncbi:bifunctional diguanylate cyclase/phosphodiesterase [Dactylosporangium sp. NBC_01737]|uniref:putative bifunctional diguanylate cyclase/phosphodiesterase n=1 Tax=Dactylosporangium sp. NBC_01737 TaxID=2975959 RepID=UPI002E10997B|nr:bifunctional diguanylate cyclase/phosphodiesterase [Dactylosporangium sp. NBC_01737]
MIVVLLSVAGLGVVGVARTRHAAETVARSTALSDAYARANKAIAEEESLERKYRLDRGDEVRARHAIAGAALHSALSDVESRGGATDRDLALRLRHVHDEYGYAVLRVFAAVDNGDLVEAARINNNDVDRIFYQLGAEIQRAADLHAGRATAAIEELRRVEALVFAALLGAVGVGGVLLIGLGLMVMRYQNTMMAQADRHEHAARHDALTGLPNRTLYTERLEQVLAVRDAVVTVMLLDLDRFKEVNDTLGHHYGDELLVQVAARLTGEVRAGDTVARLSGDEFAVLLPGADVDHARSLAGRLQERLHQSFVLRDVTVDVEASIGIAVRDAAAAARSADELLRAADVAMYEAKDTKHGAVVYEPATTAAPPSRLLLLGDLRRALSEREELELYYQPKIALATGELCGVEALIRWHHPTRGMVVPGEFVPMAENTGLINLLATHVLARAVAQAAAWRASGVDVPVAVNLSPRCLTDATLQERVEGLLVQHRLPARLLRLEVTESAVMANPALATATLRGLHRLGVRLSIDDYGTGYSSMAYLKQLPVDELKIDRSFVVNLSGADDDDAVLVRSAVDLGHNLGMTVVAEGVEHAGQVEALRRLGCDIAQGFHYARPEPADRLQRWLQPAPVH